MLAIILLSTSANSIALNENTLLQAQIPLKIKEVTYTPQFPRENQAITITASIIHQNPVDTVLLFWKNKSNLFIKAILSAQTESDTYKGVIPGHPSGETIEFYVYANDTLGNEDRWPAQGTTIIKIHGSSNPLNPPLNQTINIGKGAQYINSSEAEIALSMNLNHSIQLTIQLIDSHELNSTNMRKYAFSKAVRITVNNSNAILDAQLVFKLDLGKIKKYKLSDGDLAVYTREGKEPWTPINATISISKGKASLNTTRFSDWVVASSDPILELTLTPSQIKTTVNQEVSILTTVINEGGADLLNINLTVYHVKDIINTSGFTQATLPSLSPNDSKELKWKFKAKSTGDYVLVFFAYAGENYTATVSLNLQVTESLQTTNTKESFASLSLFIPFVSLTILLDYKSLKRKYSYQASNYYL